MQSKIIERMLTENNKTLQEIINVVKDNAIFNAAMRDIKDGYFVDDEIHGMSHNERVTLLACYIGIKEDLSDEELKLVLEAAKYHDIGRGYEVNHNHGQFSTVIIDRNKEYIFPSLDDNEINIIKALCHGHSIDDKRYEEIARLYGIKDIKQIKKLLDIVKDADALDRVRLQRFGKLDEKYLRTDTSKGLTEFAENLFREYRNIQQEILAEDKKTESTYSFSTELRDQLLFDGENYYLLRSLNRADIDSLNSGNGIIPKIDSLDAHTVQDVMAQIRMQHRKTNLISMSEEPNIVLTYDKSNLHRFVLIRLSKEEIEDSKKVFSAGEYLLGVMDSEIERIVTNAPEKVREIIENVDKATSIEEIVKIINGADRQVPTSLVETQQQYLSSEEQLNQSKKIAKCKVLNYYGLMRGIAHDEKGKLIDISGFTQIMRNGFSSSEWLYSGKIPQDKIINIPQILIDSLALLKQAEFQGKDKEIIRKIEKEVLDLAISGEKINQDNYQLEYSAHNDLKNDLTIDKAFEITNGEISYRDTNMQQIAIRSLAEMTLNKRRIIELLKERLPDIDIEGLLSDTYCINQEMVTRQNNKGSQIGRNINFLISDYGYDFDEETSRRILESVENLTDEQLKSIISQGINAQEISNLLIKIRGKEERIETTKYKKKSVKYLAEAIVEGYNWKKDSNSLTKKEKELLAKDLLRGEKIGNGLYELYEAINKIQIGKNKFTQNEVFAIIINLAIDGKIGDILYSDLLRKDIREIQHILLDYKEELQTSVLPISMDLLAGKGKEIDRLKKELIDLGIDKEFIESKDIKNVYIAKKIVEEYIFERDISTKEKASLIKAVLKNNKLNSDSSYHLTSLILNMEQIGLATQEIYGMIINLGVNENIIEETGYAYSSLLGNINNACQTIAEFKDKIQTKVTEGTIHVAVSENLNKEEQEQIKSELIELGIDREFIESKKIKNIYSAKQIVEKYKFGRAINTKEKASLIKAILNNSKLNNNNSSNLTTFIQNMEQIGLSTQEIYGMIINLGINGSVLEELGYDYSSILGNTNNVCQTIAQYKDRIQTKVTAGTIDVAVSENLNKEEQEQIRSELIELGIDKEFIELKGTKNIYIAKQIVERYDFERDINVKEKASLIKAILNKSVLNTDRRIYLTTLVQNMERIGLSTREICGLIINLGVNGKVLEETGYDYSYLLANTKDSCQTIAQYKDRIQTKVTAGTIDVAVSENLNKKEQEQIKYELVELGIDSEFIELKDIKNIYIAKQIVERYDFERDINVKEKASLIKAILNNSGLNADRSLYLTTLVQNMEQIGLSTQEIYGMIINLCTNGKVLEETGYGYADLLANTKNACQTIAQYKDRIQTKVTVGTIDTAGFGNLNEIEKKQIKTELIELGIDREFIESKKTKNIYFAKQIVEKYEFGIDINAKEKASLIKAILNNSALNSEKTSNLITFIQNMEQIGLSTQEIYGMIINLSVNGSALEKTGYNYKSLLCNTNNACQTIAEFKDKIQTKVTESTIDVAVCKNLNKNEQEQIRSELIELGIEKEFLESKDIKNIYFAKQIVEKYNFEREISKEEKASLIKAILNNSRLNKNRGCYITKLIQSAEQIGLSTQEIYGMIINLGVNEKVLEKGGYSYSLLLQNKDNALQTIAQYRDEIQIEVTEETIQKAVKKANQPKKVKGQDIAKATMELTVKGSGGSQICDDVQADYMRLLDEKTNNNQKEGSEQGDEN